MSVCAINGCHNISEKHKKDVNITFHTKIESTNSQRMDSEVFFMYSDKDEENNDEPAKPEKLEYTEISTQTMHVHMGRQGMLTKLPLIPGPALSHKKRKKDGLTRVKLKCIMADACNYTVRDAIQKANKSIPFTSVSKPVQVMMAAPSYNFAAKFMNWKRYHRLNVIYSFLDELERDFPAICTVSVIGTSVEGRHIKMLKISNSKATNEAIWLDAAIHSREWISTAVVTYIANYIVKNFKGLSPSFTDKDWYIVPVLNPDGYEYTHTRDRMWRKNRARYGGRCVGVDLNRNFSYGWGNHGEEGSSDQTTSAFYRGPEPFSEPETIAVRDTILGSTTPFKVFLSFHSYFEVIIFPWGCREEIPPDYLNLLEGGAVMARAIYDTNGMSYKVGNTKDLTYDACGTSTDWSYSIAKIPYSYMVELRSKKYRFRLPKDQIIDTCTEIVNGLSSFLQFVDDH